MFSGPEVNPRAFRGWINREKEMTRKRRRRAIGEAARKGLSSPLIRAAIGDREYEIKAHGIVKVIYRPNVAVARDGASG